MVQLVEPWPGSAIDLVEEYRCGRRSPVDEVRVALAAIGRSQLNAVCHLDMDRAIAAAESVDLELPLAGVPFLVKELERVDGWPLIEASLSLAGRLADVTSTQVVRLQAAGAIPLGQSTSAEFARAAYTATAAHGVTRNPWDITRTPGGSSGGSAAAVSGGLVPLATHTDGGGSARLPAAYCGLPGLKPTMRLVPAGPSGTIEPLTVVVGCLTRTIRDLARTLDVTVGLDGRDLFGIPAEPVFEQGLGETEVAGLHIVTLPGFGGSSPEPAVRAALTVAIDRLVKLIGLVQVDITAALPPPDRRLGLPGALRIVGLTGDLAPEQEALMNLEVREALVALRAASLVDIGSVDQARMAIIEAIADIFEDTDLIATATVPTEAFGAEGPNRGNPAAALGPVSVAGYPAISLPMGHGPAGLPLGLQLIGRPFSEPILLEIGSRWESLAPWPLVAPGSPW